MEHPVEGASDGNHPRILVVDDDDLIQVLLTEVLTEESYRVTCASDGLQAVDLMGPGMYDLVITDLVLPGLDGKGVLQKSKSADPETPVIVITGYASVETAEMLIDLGAADYIPKPFNIDLIKVTVAKVLRMRDRFKAQADVGEVPAIDSLTESFNLAAFHRILDEELDRSRWRGRQCGVLIAGISDFTLYSVEERLQLVTELVNLARSEAHPGDPVGRTGEAEVSMIVSESPADDALMIGERIAGKAVIYDLQTGVATFPRDGADAMGLMKAARRRMSGSS